MSIHQISNQDNTFSINSIPMVGGPASAERQIDETARMIIGMQMSEGDRRSANAEMLQGRVEQLTHVPVNGLRGSVLFLNMNQIGLEPTPICPYYRKMRVPTVSTYGNIGSNIASITLSPEAQRFIPEAVLSAAGDLNGKHVDLLWTAVDARFLARDNRSFNLCTHAWAHPYALPRENVAFDVQMGIFPEIGFAQCHQLGAIAIGGLSPMRVHAHDDLYSPDNAHFERIPNSPFGVLWSVIEKDNRVAITKMLVLFDYDHPICQRLVNTIRNCGDLNTHMIRLGLVQNGIDETFAQLLRELQGNDPNFLRTFQALPSAFQYGIFKEAYILKGSLRGIHGDFGRASFLADPSLNIQHHCNNEERIQAVIQFKQQLSHLLIASQDDLLCKSQPLVKGDNVLRMLACADLINAGQIDNGLNMFLVDLSQNEQRAVYLAAWELSGCPQENLLTIQQQNSTPMREELGIAWGERNFHLLGGVQARALLLAASRQPPVFDQNPVQTPSSTTTVDTSPTRNTAQIAVNCDVGFGNTLGIKAASNWNETIPFRYESGQWRGTVLVGTDFKFVRIAANGTVAWENGLNRQVRDSGQAQSEINSRSVQF